MSSLDQFAINPGSPAAEEKTGIEKLSLTVIRGNKILQRPKVPLSEVKMWVGAVRNALFNTYGKNSPILDLFLHPKDISPLADPREFLESEVAKISSLVNELNKSAAKVLSGNTEGKVFIGHGQSPLWRELKDFLSDRLNLKWDEFNREAVAGLSTFERIATMLEEASFAFLIMTAEDGHNDNTIHARQNVVHEVGLFQGRLGPKKAIILLEEGCSEFSNIIGLIQIRFPKNRISAAFEEIRRVLEREKII